MQSTIMIFRVIFVGLGVLFVNLVVFAQQDVIFTAEPCNENQRGLFAAVPDDPRHYKQCGPAGFYWILQCAPDTFFNAESRSCAPKDAPSPSEKIGANDKADEHVRGQSPAEEELQANPYSPPDQGDGQQYAVIVDPLTFNHSNQFSASFLSGVVVERPKAPVAPLAPAEYGQQEVTQAPQSRSLNPKIVQPATPTRKPPVRIVIEQEGSKSPGRQAVIDRDKHATSVKSADPVRHQPPPPPEVFNGNIDHRQPPALQSQPQMVYVPVPVPYMPYPRSGLGGPAQQGKYHPEEGGPMPPFPFGPMPGMNGFGPPPHPGYIMMPPPPPVPRSTVEPEPPRLISLAEDCVENGTCSNDDDTMDVFCLHGNDPTRYFICSPHPELSGVWIEQQCPAGLHFAGDRCDRPARVHTSNTQIGKPPRPTVHVAVPVEPARLLSTAAPPPPSAPPPPVVQPLQPPPQPQPQVPPFPMHPYPKPSGANQQLIQQFVYQPSPNNMEQPQQPTNFQPRMEVPMPMVPFWPPGEPMGPMFTTQAPVIPWQFFITGNGQEGPNVLPPLPLDRLPGSPLASAGQQSNIPRANTWPPFGHLVPPPKPDKVKAIRTPPPVLPPPSGNWNNMLALVTPPSVQLPRGWPQQPTNYQQQPWGQNRNTNGGGNVFTNGQPQGVPMENFMANNGPKQATIFSPNGNNAAPPQTPPVLGPEQMYALQQQQQQLAMGTLHVVPAIPGSRVASNQLMPSAPSYNGPEYIFPYGRPSSSRFGVGSDYRPYQHRDSSTPAPVSEKSADHKISDRIPWLPMVGQRCSLLASPKAQIFPDPGNRKGFYMCSPPSNADWRFEPADGQWTLLECPEDTIFNVELKVCDKSHLTPQQRLNAERKQPTAQRQSATFS